jgi:hypothetical protein
MTTHQIGFGSPWYVRTPTIHRYLKERQWVEEFLSTGRIRLAAFREFRNHPDEVRKDEGEGFFGSEKSFAPPEGSQAKPLFLHISGDAGRRSYVLCACVRRDDTFTKFGTNYITIADTTAFAAHIARQLPGFERGWEGFCIYGGNRYTSSEVSEGEAAAVYKALESGQRPPSPVSFPVLFAKPTKFAEELEYRLIWEVDHDVTEAIFVVAPKARAACL